MREYKSVVCVCFVGECLGVCMCEFSYQRAYVSVYNSR